MWHIIVFLWTPTGCIENNVVDPGDRGLTPSTSPQDPDLDTQQDVFLRAYQPVDLLLIVDDSCSMGDDQAGLVGFIPNLAQPLLDYGIDYHVGSTTTSCQVNEACGIVSWFGADQTDNLVLDMTPLVQVGLDGWGEEMGSKALAAALHRGRADAANAGFFRAEVPLEVIIISDEPDYSTERMQNTVVYRELDELALRYNKEVRIHAVTRTSEVPPLVGVPLCSALGGPQYAELAEATGGLVVDICAEDWSPVMDKIAAGFLHTRTVFPLSRVPQEDSLVVEVETECCTVYPGDMYPHSWSYYKEKNVVVFTTEGPADRLFPVEAAERVLINYTVAQ